ncbi:alpha/beta fold hydrolase [Xanthobacter sediminis]
MYLVVKAAEALLASIPRPQVIPTPRGPLVCAIDGDGPPLLALHGIMGGLDQSWLLARALLARGEGRRVISVARPGYDGTPLETGRTAEEQAEAYAAVLEALGLGAAHVAAFSGGGPSALAFARLYPERCRGLVLVSACTGRLEAPPEARAGFTRLGAVVWLPALPQVPAWVMRHWPHVPARSFVPDHDQRARLFADPEAGPLFTALLLSSFTDMDKRLPGTLNDLDQFARLPSCCGAGLSTPMLAVHGTADGIVPFVHGVELARQAPGARLLAVEGGTHMALFTHLARVREAAAGLLGADA